MDLWWFVLLLLHLKHRTHPYDLVTHMLQGCLTITGLFGRICINSTLTKPQESQQSEPRPYFMGCILPRYVYGNIYFNRFRFHTQRITIGSPMQMPARNTYWTNLFTDVTTGIMARPQRVSNIYFLLLIWTSSQRASDSDVLLLICTGCWANNSKYCSRDGKTR